MDYKGFPRQLAVGHGDNPILLGVDRVCLSLTPEPRFVVLYRKRGVLVQRFNQTGAFVTGEWDFRPDDIGVPDADLWRLRISAAGVTRQQCYGRPEYSLEQLEWSLVEFMKICNGLELQEFLTNRAEYQHLMPDYTSGTERFTNQRINAEAIPW